ncbi:DUF3618 domain-containing protein [Glaciihabitans sp. dw_435]|uniref:DUF3618 domain-containing protein n=1 Tax=Glaciihabitans sp. dw_435 TaxID=2720081 RepID=UPI001BD5027E|nr:DUF3618 domain-containing protein [Glaciihabitans sp. dw_435]
MSDTTPAPGEDAGINEIRLDADRTRDELRDTLDQIEGKLTPQYAVESLKREFRERPFVVIAAAIGVVGAIVGVIVLAVRSGADDDDRTTGRG